jgi:putative peptidoglycan lipid II flippase
MRHFSDYMRMLSRYSLLSLLGLFFGLWRESVVSSHFGLSASLDVYVAVSAFYLFFGVQIANTLEMVFISKEAKSDGTAQITAQMWQAAKVLALTDGLMCVALWIAAEPMVKLFFPGFSESQVVDGVDILHKLLLAIVLANLCGILKASLNLLNVFVPGLVSGTVISVCSGGAVLLYAGRWGLDALVYGFVLGHCLVFALLLGAYIRVAGWQCVVAGIRTSPRGQRLWQAAGIVLLGEVAYQGFVLSERGFGSTLPAGTISAFYYAWAIYAVPMTLVVTPAYTTVYPKLAKAFAADVAQGYAVLRETIPGLLLFSLAPVFVTTLWSSQLVEIVLLRGRFNAQDVQLTAEILTVLIYSMPFAAVGRVLRYSLYSIGKYASASASQCATLASMVLIAPILVPTYGVIGLAMASMVAVSAQSVLMYLLLRRHTR